eukprot:COSAG02_NODE_39929_length_411_cov_0.666667_1_plen_23_part_01
MVVVDWIALIRPQLLRQLPKVTW